MIRDLIVPCMWWCPTNNAHSLAFRVWSSALCFIRCSSKAGASDGIASRLGDTRQFRCRTDALRPRQLIRPSSRDGLTADFHWRQILRNVACSIGSAVRPCMSATSARLARDIERPHRVDKSPVQRSRLDRLGFIYIELVFCTLP